MALVTIARSVKFLPYPANSTQIRHTRNEAENERILVESMNDFWASAYKRHRIIFYVAV
jgi:hypothetical protein